MRKVEVSVSPHQAAQSVLEVLAGAPLHQVAARAGMNVRDLADAIEVYQAAGEHALDAQAEAAQGWYSVSIQFTAWNAAEQTALTGLVPQLEQSEKAGALANWWFLRKYPCWRLRCRPGSSATRADAEKVVSTILDRLIADGLVNRWWQTIYEPESLAFGGPQGMDAAHDLFHADSRGVLDYLRRHGFSTMPGGSLGRREVSVLLCSALFFGAGQEPHEQGDTWHRVEQLRPLPSDTPPSRLTGMTAALQVLMTLNTSPTSPLFNERGPLAFLAPWADAFETAGRRLGGAAHAGTLHRGVRDVLAHHVIFAWNRMGLDSRTQAILARAARDTAMNPSAALPGTPPSGGS
ncbi:MULTISPECIES: thiopeptide-type bacteriocin biosynthesis protein [Streptomyces]|uniref:thiopeptide-type bacteriocin biosynthesis protein n=1 Tax=Streptomyces TaxID=1883 RepID=UPI0029ABD0F9|nr:thiopeptide-type bacteriocin biosynthesis protein [Streptomyces europaeiscabiei]MDX3715776.1 thiopeptide-type bacteriocin biosynthesis protein [Streptomyces europaeiscabiei]WSG19985.1 thiopeptide-type bacteriocin biosynthesis protein [Streptomyces europaeiscabiei]